MWSSGQGLPGLERALWKEELCQCLREREALELVHEDPRFLDAQNAWKLPANSLRFQLCDSSCATHIII